MELYWKVFVFCGFFLKLSFPIHGATTTIDLLNSRSFKNGNYLPSITAHNNADKSFQHMRLYTSKSARSLNDFNTRPQIKPSTLSSSQPSIYSSYIPPPSGLISYTNFQLPLENSVKSPIFIPNPTQVNDYTKHPGFMLIPSSQKNMEKPTLLIEEPANSTIEAAKMLASTLLKATGEGFLEARPFQRNRPSNFTDLYIVRSQKKAYIIPMHFQKEARNSNAAEELYPLREQFDKAYIVNQFIFVIKPEKINFLNKLI